MQRHLLSNGTKSIVIYEMIHLAPVAFYEHLQAWWKRDHSNGMVIHLEGVTGMGEVGERYRDTTIKLAHILGFVTQPKPEVPWERKDITFTDLTPRQQRKIKFLLTYFNKTINYLIDAGTAKEVFADMIKNIWAEPNVFQRIIRAVLLSPFNDALLDVRNKVAVMHALDTDKNVSMVWGKLHAPGVIRLLEDQGYELVESVSTIEHLETVDP